MIVLKSIFLRISPSREQDASWIVSKEGKCRQFLKYINLLKLICVHQSGIHNISGDICKCQYIFLIFIETVTLHREKRKGCTSRSEKSAHNPQNSLVIKVSGFRETTSKNGGDVYMS